MLRILALMTTLAILSTPDARSVDVAPHFTWDKLPPLPSADGKTPQVGVAFPFVGVHNGALLVGGGANFPGSMPWKGGVKTWHDTLYVLELEGPRAGQWNPYRGKLPRPLAYGASISVEDGVLCLGGCDATRCYADVFLLRWNPAKKQVTAIELPPLPGPLAFMGVGYADGIVYVSCGQETVDKAGSSTHLWALDYAKWKRTGGQAQWQMLPPLPGERRILPVAFALSSPQPAFYVFSGRKQTFDAPTVCLADGWRFVPATGKWEPISAPASLKRGAEGQCIMAGTGLPYDSKGAVILGGADGERFMRFENFLHQIKALQAQLELPLSATEKKIVQSEIYQLQKQNIHELENHTGFSRDIYYYDGTADSWTRIGELPPWPPVTTTAALWKGRILLPSGEIRPGTRTADVFRGTPVKQK